MWRTCCLVLSMCVVFFSVILSRPTSLTLSTHLLPKSQKVRFWLSSSSWEKALLRIEYYDLFQYGSFSLTWQKNAFFPLWQLAWEPGHFPRDKAHRNIWHFFVPHLELVSFMTTSVIPYLPRGSSFEEVSGTRFCPDKDVVFCIHWCVQCDLVSFMHARRGIVFLGLF